uniref:AIG1-type G domain-containing protein n=1 Tax=Cyprinus carpio carpio TaxID=630221 RepID=A0A9J8BWC0_CYPCA
MDEPLRMNSRHDAILLKEGPLMLYRLNTERKYIDGTDKKVRQWTYGRRDRNKLNKVILMVGQTGTGKTTIINTMVNYLLGVKFEDQEFYYITEENEDKDQSQSQTSEITVYEVFVEENPTSLTIIDTPGYADTEGYEKDRELSESLIRLFSDEDGIHYIDAVCFVMKASDNRLSEKEFYIFHSVLSLFGRDIGDNIVFLLTYSSGCPPEDALNAIKKAEIPCRRDENNEPVYFLFNNQQKVQRDQKYKRALKSAWEMGEESINELFTLLDEKNRKRVQMTLNVLKERRQLEACVSNLVDKISEKELKTNELNGIQEALRQNRDKIGNCENFEFTSYESNVKDSTNKTEIEQKIINDLEEIKIEKSKLLNEAYVTITRLSEIALKADSAFTLQHVDFLILRLKEEGKDEWMKNLEDMKKAGEQKKNKGAVDYLMAFGKHFFWG